jgi:large subunit ribosomal protein L24
VAASRSIKKINEPVPTALKKGDVVMVIAGGNKNKRPIKGQVAKIKAIVGDNNDRVVLEGLNLFTKHKKALAPGQEGGKVKVERPMHISNVMYYAEKLKRPVRLVKSTLADGKKVRGYRDPSSKNFVQIDG